MRNRDGASGCRIGGGLRMLQTSRWLRGAACAVCAAGLACATPVTPRAPEGRVGYPERPHAPADYDVLVGELAAADGRVAEARAAFARAIAKDSESAYLERALSRIEAHLQNLDSALAHGWRAVELDPDDHSARLLLGRIYRMRRDVEGAERALLGPDGNPVGPEAVQLVLQVYLEANRPSEALAMARDLVAASPERLGAHMALASVYERMGRPGEAELALRTALEHHPGAFVLYSRLARLRRAAGDREGEIAVYREVLKKQPRHYGTRVSLAEALVAQDRLEEAIGTYAELVAQYPRDPRSIRRLAMLEVKAGRPGRAADHLRAALERNPEQWQIAYVLAQVWASLDEAEASMRVFGSIPESHELYADARLQIAGILEAGESYAAALAEVDRVRALEPSRELDFHAASLRWRTGDFEGGVALLEALRAADPEDDEVLYQLGVLHGLANKTDEALRYMRAVLERNPDHAQALNYIGYSYADRGENLDEAEAMILRALELQPDDGYIVDSLAWVYVKRARPLLGVGRSDDARQLLERARDQLTRAAQLTGGDPVVSEHLGDVHLLLEEKKAALSYYEEALSLDPRPDEQPDLMDKLEGLRRELQQR